MQALTKELIETIQELQSMQSLQAFGLAGGTNLALRFNHRQSIDVDLFTNEMIGLAGMQAIEAEMQQFYGDNLTFCEVEDPGGEQYCWLKAQVRKGKDVFIKVEVIQNMGLTESYEDFDGLRLLTIKDIALLKLMTASNRKAKKDIYDLDYLTDEIPFRDLMLMLADKQSSMNGEASKCLFDLDDEGNPLDDVALLLAFDKENYTNRDRRPNHTHDNIDIVDGSKSWRDARRSWMGKVKDYMKANNLELPPVTPIN